MKENSLRKMVATGLTAPFPERKGSEATEKRVTRKTNEATGLQNCGATTDQRPLNQTPNFGSAWCARRSTNCRVGLRVLANRAGVPTMFRRRFLDSRRHLPSWQRPHPILSAVSMRPRQFLDEVPVREIAPGNRGLALRQVALAARRDVRSPQNPCIHKNNEAQVDGFQPHMAGQFGTFSIGLKRGHHRDPHKMILHRSPPAIWPAPPCS